MERDDAVARLRAQLDAESVTTLWNMGQALSLEETVVLARL
jgi:hypothetical protein